MVAQTSVVFINGSASSGKDQFVKFCQEYKDIPLRIDSLSSIDPIRRLFEVKETDKRPETRQFLAVVGKAAEEFCNYRSRETAYNLWSKRVAYTDITNSNTRHIVFIHTRELQMMRNIVDQVRMRVYDIDDHMTFKRLLIQRTVDTVVDNNESDREANNADPVDYNVVINNNGTLLDLKREAEGFVQSYSWA